MNAAKNSGTSNIPRYLILILSISMLLISSCPIKKGVMSLAGIPTETDSPSPKILNPFAAYLAEICEQSESADAQLAQLKTVLATDYLPVLLFTITTFLFISFGHSVRKKFPRHGKYHIPTYLPLFLQHRRLII